MKLDVEALAGSVIGRERETQLIGVDKLEAFARLIVERCAVECDERKHAGYAGAALAGKAIRQLLEDK